LATIIDERRKVTTSPKSQRAIKVWQESDYAAAIIANSGDTILNQAKGSQNNT
jgi:hypothetical protein